jgi:hypothetical protein
VITDIAVIGKANLTAGKNGSEEIAKIAELKPLTWRWIILPVSWWIIS